MPIFVAALAPGPRMIFNLKEEYKQQYQKLKNIYAQITIPISLSLEHGVFSTTVLKVIDEGESIWS
jgi:hypothetical protein